MKKMMYLFLMLIASCSDRHKEVNISFEEMNPIIHEYIYSHPQYNTFLLKVSDEEQFSAAQFPSGYTIGPCYKEMVEVDGDRFDSFVDIGNNRIFIMQEHKSKQNVKGLNWINRNQKESCIADSIDGIWEKAPWINFIVRAVFIYKEGDRIITNQRPDTIFVVPRATSSIHFSTDSI